MIEYTARKTKNRRRVIVEKLQEKGIRKQLQDAQVNHSLSFEQVSDEWLETYGISEGEELIKIFSSFISDEISNFKTDLYYQNPDYLKCSYNETF